MINTSLKKHIPYSNCFACSEINLQNSTPAIYFQRSIFQTAILQTTQNSLESPCLFGDPPPKQHFGIHLGLVLAAFCHPCSIFYRARFLDVVNGILIISACFCNHFLRQRSRCLPMPSFPSLCFKWPVSLGCGGVALRLQSADPCGLGVSNPGIRGVYPP